jgi:hypothetical protein
MNMKKLNVLLSAFVFVLALSAAFVTHANERSVIAKNKFNPSGWLKGHCDSSAAVDQTSCNGGSNQCTIGTAGPVYSSAQDCRNQNPAAILKFN